MKKIILLIFVAGFAAGTLFAADFRKAPNGDALNVPNSWRNSTNVAALPSAAGTDTAVFDSLMGTANLTSAIGGNLSLQGIRMATDGRAMTITASPTPAAPDLALTLGTGGIELNANPTVTNNLSIASGLVINAAQEWKIANTREVQLRSASTAGGVTLNANITASAAAGFTTGAIAFYNGVEFKNPSGSGRTITAGRFNFNEAGTVTFSGANSISLLGNIFNNQNGDKTIANAIPRTSGQKLTLGGAGSTISTRDPGNTVRTFNFTGAGETVLGGKIVTGSGSSFGNIGVQEVLLRFTAPGNEIGRISIGSTTKASVVIEPGIDVAAFSTDITNAAVNIQNASRLDVGAYGSLTADVAGPQYAITFNANNTTTGSILNIEANAEVDVGGYITTGNRNVVNVKSGAALACDIYVSNGVTLKLTRDTALDISVLPDANTSILNIEPGADLEISGLGIDGNGVFEGNGFFTDFGIDLTKLSNYAASGGAQLIFENNVTTLKSSGSGSEFILTPPGGFHIPGNVTIGGMNTTTVSTFVTDGKNKFTIGGNLALFAYGSTNFVGTVEVGGTTFINGTNARLSLTDNATLACGAVTLSSGSIGGAGEVFLTKSVNSASPDFGKNSVVSMAGDTTIYANGDTIVHADINSPNNATSRYQGTGNLTFKGLLFSNTNTATASNNNTTVRIDLDAGKKLTFGDVQIIAPNTTSTRTFTFLAPDANKNHTTEIAGTIFNGKSSPNGNIQFGSASTGLTGTGTFILSGDNSGSDVYKGTTTVIGGNTLLVAGDYSGATGDVIINSGVTLRGNDGILGGKVVMRTGAAIDSSVDIAFGNGFTFEVNSRINFDGIPITVLDGSTGPSSTNGGIIIIHLSDAKGTWRYDPLARDEDCAEIFELLSYFAYVGNIDVRFTGAEIKGNAPANLQIMLPYNMDNAIIRHLVFTPYPLTVYDHWVTANNLEGLDALTSATPYGDGITNLAKFALGLDGKGFAQYSDTGYYIAESNADEITFTYAISKKVIKDGKTPKDDTTVTPRISNDLQTWKPTTRAPQLVGTVGDLEIYEVTESLENTEKVFFRLEITRNPRQ